MKSIHLPMLVSGSSVFLARQAGGFDLRACPDGEELAAFVVYACNNHDALVASNNELRDQVTQLKRDMEGLLAAGNVLAEDIVHKQAVQDQLVAALKAAHAAAHKVLIAGGDYGDELDDQDLRKELKDSKSIIDAALTAAGAA